MKVRENQARLLKTLSHPTRLAVLEILRDGEQCVCHLETMLGLRQASISQQLMVLREAGLVGIRRDGLNVYYRVSKPRLFEILDAVNSASGKPRARIGHKHDPAECPCPKCNAEKHISPDPESRIKAHR